MRKWYIAHAQIGKGVTEILSRKKIIARFHLLLLLNKNRGLFDLPNSEVSFLWPLFLLKKNCYEHHKHLELTLTLIFTENLYRSSGCTFNGSLFWYPKNPFHRFSQLVLSDCNSFPQFTQLVASDCNSFTRFKQLFLRDYNLLPRFNLLIRGKELHSSLLPFTLVFLKSLCPFRAFVNHISNVWLFIWCEMFRFLCKLMSIHIQ